MAATLTGHALLPALLLIISCIASPPGAECRAFFGPLLFGGGVGNSSALGALAQAHLQHKLDTLNALSDLFAIGINRTQAVFGSFG